MDAISLINEALQIVYSLIPQELFIVILAVFIMGIFTKRGDRDSAKKNY